MIILSVEEEKKAFLIVLKVRVVQEEYLIWVVLS